MACIPTSIMHLQRTSWRDCIVARGANESPIKLISGLRILRCQTHHRKSVFARPAQRPGRRGGIMPGRRARKLAELAGRKTVPVISFREVPLAHCAGVPLLRRACDLLFERLHAGIFVFAADRRA